MNHTFEIKDQFYLDGEPFQIISGAFHYFRTVPEYWRDRMEKMKNLGCNTVETYIPWNFMEPERGKFLWDGMRDIARFIETAQELGLYVIIRPSPYICAEWEFGGLPAWLLKDKNMRLRCSYKPYLDEVYAYYKELIPRLAPYQITDGGTVILVQIENEYGYFGNDKEYLKFLADTMREFGIRVPFVTSDGPWGKTFEAGMLDGVLQTGNFGSDIPTRFSFMREVLGEGRPLMCMEFWMGWFDAWGEEHHTSDLAQNVKDLDEAMQRGSFNFYMFEGGTNFGFMSGKNQGAKTADVTSYDYDAVLTEDGQITEKYRAFQEVIGKYKELPQMKLSTKIERREYGAVKLDAKAGLFAVLDQIARPTESSYTLSMEEIDQSYGYTLYQTTLAPSEAAVEIQLEGAADRVSAYENGKYLFTLEGEELEKAHRLEKYGELDIDGGLGDPAVAKKAQELMAESAGATLFFLTECVGRVNFGAGIDDQRKGITKGVRVNGHRQAGFSIYPLPLDGEQIEKIPFPSACGEKEPAFYRFTVEIAEPADTFLDCSGFGKGVAFINGFNLGRFWDIGPQRTLYVPAPLLRAGSNTLILFETEGKAADQVFFSAEPRLG